MTRLPEPLRRAVPLRRLMNRLRLVRWVLGGRAGPPPSLVKQAIVRRYARAYHVRVLVETGTYMGDMVDAVRRDFDVLYSIELSETLHAYARRRLARFPHVRLLLGDSATVLGEVLKEVTGPCLFWLDSHYSGGETARAAVETPIVAELQAIARHAVKGHVILIDDARRFDGTADYPDVGQLGQIAASLFPASNLQVAEDVIRIVCAPGGTARGA
jgi:hypothetical protein